MSLLRALLRREPDAPAPKRTRGARSVSAPPEPPASSWPAVVGPADAILYGTVIALIAFGVVMVYSASSVFASQRFDDGMFFLVRQGIFALVALPLIVALARVDYHRYRPLTYPLLIVVGRAHARDHARLRPHRRRRHPVDRGRAGAHPTRGDGEGRDDLLPRLLALQEAREDQELQHRLSPARDRRQRAHAALPQAARLRQRRDDRSLDVRALVHRGARSSGYIHRRRHRGAPRHLRAHRQLSDAHAPDPEFHGAVREPARGRLPGRRVAAELRLRRFRRGSGSATVGRSCSTSPKRTPISSARSWAKSSASSGSRCSSSRS